MQDCLAYDVHQGSSKAKTCLDQIKLNFTDRPKSVESVHLSDSEEHCHKPKANMSDLTANWH